MDAKKREAFELRLEQLMIQVHAVVSELHISDISIRDKSLRAGELREEINHNSDLIENYKKRLRILERQVAKFGDLNVPANLLIEIEDVTINIQRCEDKILFYKTNLIVEKQKRITKIRVDLFYLQDVIEAITESLQTIHNLEQKLLVSVMRRNNIDIYPHNSIKEFRRLMEKTRASYFDTIANLSQESLNLEIEIEDIQNS